MRPLLVLILVIVAVATLLFALFSLSGDGTGNTVAEIESTPVKPRGPIEDVEFEPVPDGAVETEEESAPSGNTREEVEIDHLVYHNALVGQVLDPEGLPVSGVSLTLSSGAAPGGVSELQKMFAHNGDTSRTRTGRSNDQGRFRFRNLEPGGYSLTAEHSEFSRREVPYLMVHHEGETALNVQLEEGLMIHGHVRNEAGDAIPNADLVLSSMFLGALFAPDPARRLEDASLEVETDEAGYYRFTNITPGQMHLTAIADGYGRQTKRNLNVRPKNGIHEFNFRLGPSAAIAGRVFAPDRTAIVDATVEVIGYQPPQSLKAVTTTDRRGRFSLPDLVEGAYLLTVRAQGWGIERRQRVEATVPATEIDIEMAEQGTIMGQVLDGGDGKPVASYVATLHQFIEQSGAYGRSVKEEKFASAEGTFTMRGVSEGRYAIQVKSGGYAATYSTDFEVTQGLTTTDVVIRLGRGGRITGRLFDSGTGKAVAKAKIFTKDNDYRENALTRVFAAAMPQRTTSQHALTDKDGYFEMELLAPDVYQVVIEHPRYPRKTIQDVRVLEGEETELGRVAMEAGGTVRGTVFDRAGDPLAGANVTIANRDHSVEMINIQSQSDPNGRYLIANVPEGEYTLTASRPHRADSPFTIILDIKNSEVVVSVSAGRELSQDLYLGG